jgi:hypothetical protein
MQARNAPGEDEALCILTRSHDIYYQSVTLYNQALQKPWNRIPGFLMGFRWIYKENANDDISIKAGIQKNKGK